ncbi:MAG TPA: NUDIX domain-containing protein [Acidimicrobiales bacterium]|nr:NUDIX domain-containing protein [Acidimicrobiales bacterium]
MKRSLLIVAARLYQRVMSVVWKVFKPTTVGVRGIVRDPDGKVVLVRHTYLSGWHLPGGGVKRRETIDQAVRRELREEVGVEVGEGEDALHILGAYTFATEGKQDHIAVFVVDLWSPIEAHKPSFEIAERRAFALDALPEGTTPATRRRLRELTGEDRVRFLW